MKLLNELLGFVVLTGPLFLIVLWVPVCIGLGIWVGRKFIKGGTPLKIVGGVVVFLVALILPVSDEIAGRIYLNHLCETEAGMKVFQTVELPTEYWDEQGNPKFYVNRYDKNKLRFIFPDKKMLNMPKLSYTWTTSSNSNLFYIDKDTLQITDRESGTIFGEYYLFRYWGGWLVRDFSPHNTAGGCDLKDITGWELNVFEPTDIR